jgi:hypothetical protein
MMKKLIFLFILISSSLLAQEETIFSGDVEHGGYGGPEFKVTQIDNSLNLLVGGKGGWIINHSFVIGLAGYGLVTSITPEDNINSDLRLAFGYGGLNLEYINSSNRIVHFTVSALVGAGGVAWYDHSDWFDDNYDDNRHTYAGDAFFVFEPGASIELNIVKWMRIDLGVSYRLISGAESNLKILPYSTSGVLYEKSIKDKDLSGISGNITFKFGLF